jgi:myo-inositol-1(or 4)-monophosphatase
MSDAKTGVPVDTDDLLTSALAAAHAAGAVLLDRFGKHLDVGFKSRRADLVTDADHASERAIAEVISTRHPDHALMAEEGTSREGTAYRWVVDPLDGTVNFAHGIPHWCASIAVEDEGGPVVGVVHDPLRRETFAAVRGRGARRLDSEGEGAAKDAFEGGEPLAVTETERLGDALLATGFAYDPDRRAENIAYLDRLLLRIRGVRRFGSAALDLAWVACGRIDGYWEVGLSRWDIAAGTLLVREAGGRVTGFERGEDPLDTGRIIAGGHAIHPACYSILGRHS